MTHIQFIKNLRIFSAVSVLSIVAIGCADKSTGPDNSYTPTAADQESVAMIVGQDLSASGNGDMAELETAYGMAKSGKVSLSKISRDTTFNKNGLAFYRYRKFFSGSNGTGDSSDVFVSGTTSSMKFRSSIDGSIDRPLLNTFREIHNSRTLTVDGLLPASNQITINGTVNHNSYHEFKSKNGLVSNTFTKTSTGTKENVTFLKATDSIPDSGKLIYNLTMKKVKSRQDKTVEHEFTMQVEITFNGTNTPEMTVDKTRTTKKYKVNLTTGDVTEL